MAKNSSGTNRNMNLQGDYTQMQENIRKAKGNPNKNVHHKKNGSNYKGYAAAQREAQTAATRRETPKKPTWVTVSLVVIFVILVAILILMNTILKENLIFTQLATITIGMCCGILFSLRRYTKSEGSKFQDGLYIVLAVMSVVLIFMGGYGLYTLLRA